MWDLNLVTPYTCLYDLFHCIITQRHHHGQFKCYLCETDLTNQKQHGCECQSQALQLVAGCHNFEGTLWVKARYQE